MQTPLYDLLLSLQANFTLQHDGSHQGCHHSAAVPSTVSSFLVYSYRLCLLFLLSILLPFQYRLAEIEESTLSSLWLGRHKDSTYGSAVHHLGLIIIIIIIVLNWVHAQYSTYIMRFPTFYVPRTCGLRIFSHNGMKKESTTSIWTINSDWNIAVVYHRHISIIIKR